MEKGYTKKKYRRKIPKVGRSYKRHIDEDKTFDKSSDINDLVEELYLEKSDKIVMDKEELVEEHENLVQVLESPSKKDDKTEAKKQKKELKEYTSKSCPSCKSELCKGCNMSKSLDAIIDETLEKGRGKDLKPRKRKGSLGAEMDTPEYQAKRKKLYSELMDTDKTSEERKKAPVDEKAKAEGKAKRAAVEGDSDRNERLKQQYMKKSNEENSMSKSKVETEIDEMAGQMAKSTQDPRAELMATIKELGPEGLKKSMEDLSEDQKVLVKDILEEMSKGKKAVAMDANYAGDKHFATIENMGTEVEDGSDDEDEKLVLQAAASHNHQGDLSPEGREDHVIKGDYKASCGDEAEAKMDLMKKDKKKKDKPKTQGEDYSMEKSIEDIRALKDEVIKSYEDAGLDYDDVIIKSEMKKRMNKEEDQVKQSDQTTGGKKDRADKKAPDEIKVAKDASETADEAVAKVPSMKKSESEEEPAAEAAPEKVVKSLPAFDPQEKLRANTGGRNFHYSVNNYYNEALAKAQGKNTEEILEKSQEEGAEEKQDDINDILEKGYDKTMCDVAEEELQKSQIKGDFTTNSFSDKDMADAMNMSEKDYKELIGE